MTKQPLRRPSRAAVFLAALLGASTLPVVAQTGSVPAAPAPRAGRADHAELRQRRHRGVARTMSAIYRPILVDPRVKGTITLYTERPVRPDEAYNQFLAALRGLGFTVVEVGGLLKVVPEADAKLQTGTVSVGDTVSRRGNQIVTQIFRLNYENANNLVPMLRPLISPNNTINVNPGNNSLVITDYADNLRRIARIIAALDVAGHRRRRGDPAAACAGLRPRAAGAAPDRHPGGPPGVPGRPVGGALAGARRAAQQLAARERAQPGAAGKRVCRWSNGSTGPLQGTAARATSRSCT